MSDYYNQIVEIDRALGKANRDAVNQLIHMHRERARYKAALEDVLGCAWADPEIRWVVQKALTAMADLGPRPTPQPVPSDADGGAL